MDWRTHFQVRAGEVVGTTSTGRSTAALLFRATQRYSPPDLKWDKLESVAGNEHLYRFLNHLRYRRLQRVLASPLPPLSATPDEIQVAERIQRLLALELLFTRGTELDVARGIALGEQMLGRNSSATSEVRGVLSILYQQRATLRFAQNDLRGARSDQRRSFALYGQVRPPGDESAMRFAEADDLRSYLRALSVVHKYDALQWKRGALRDLVSIAVDLQDEGDFRHFTYLTDLVLLQAEPDAKALEGVYGVLTDILETGGYGATIDRARLVTLRRRWWALHCLLEAEVWYEALHADLFFWREIEMFNELRELHAYVERLRPKLDGQKYERIMGMFRQVPYAATGHEPTGRQPDGTLPSEGG
jgi:hypothetical protein